MQKARSKQGSRFYKLHGAGNDLLVLGSRDMPAAGKAAFVRRIAHRQLGVGCDQVVEILSREPLAIQIWNRDGSKAEMCANGSRTFLFLAHHEGWVDRKGLRVPLRVSDADYEGIQVSPGSYEFCLGAPEVGSPGRLRIGKGTIPFLPVRTGNPHAVVWMTGPSSWKAPSGFDFRSFGPRIETHPRFPRRTNVEFIRAWKRKGSKAEVRVEAWERGSGATLSCGSGAVAVAAAVRRRDKGIEEVSVAMTDFVLRVRFEGERAFLSGPCALVAEGVAYL